MGADNLSEFHRWRHWRDIARRLPIAVLDRPGAGWRAHASRAARVWAPARWDEADISGLASAHPPAWGFVHGPRCALSSTRIRERGGDDEC